MKNRSKCGASHSKILVVVSLVLIVGAVGSIVRTRLSLRNPVSDEAPFSGWMSDDPIRYGLAKQAAEESVRLLGSGGGRVVLVIPETKHRYRSRFGAAYEDGVRAILAHHPASGLDGIYFAPKPYRGNEFKNESLPTFARMQDIRNTHPQADLIISFLGLPQMTPAEEQSWLASDPPTLVVVEPWGLEDRHTGQRAVDSGLAAAVVVNASSSDPLPSPDSSAPQAAAPDSFLVLRP